MVPPKDVAPGLGHTAIVSEMFPLKSALMWSSELEFQYVFFKDVLKPLSGNLSLPSVHVLCENVLWLK